MYTIYVVYEGTNYQNFPHGTRYDIGSYYVKTYDFNTLKEVLKFGTDFGKAAIDEIVFFDEKDAQDYALQQTVNKLTKVYIDLHFEDESPFNPFKEE